MPATRSIYIGLFCVSAAVLILEITLTRILSILMWSHYSFLVISTAMLGFGAAGSYLAVRPGPIDEVRMRRFLGRNGLGFAASVVLSVMICTRVGYRPDLTFHSTYHTLMLPAIYAVMAVPFFFAGLSVGFVLSAYARQINALYFADLVGAGAGALAVTFLIDHVGAPAALLIAASLGIVAGTLFRGPLRRWTMYAWLGVFLILTGITLSADPWNIPVPEGKGLYANQPRVSDSRWSLLSRIDVVDEVERPLDFGCGTSAAFFDRSAAYRTFFMDGSNPSRMIRYDQDRWFVPLLLSAAPYSISAEHPRVLIIGAGGGIDVLVALDLGASDVTAVEINPVTVRMVREDYGSYIGNLFERPNVHLLAKEGRHFLSLDRNRYDVIRLTGVDTRAGSAIGANAQDHAYIHTVESMCALFDHLTDKGVLAVARTAGWQHRRLLAVATAALEQIGIQEPGDHMIVVTNGRWADLLMGKSPFRREDVSNLRRWASAAGMTIAYEPFTEAGGFETRYLRASPQERERLYRSSRANLRPVTDESPFFFEPRRLGSILQEWLGPDVNHRPGNGESALRSEGSAYPTLLLCLAGAVVLSLALIVAPLARLRAGSAGRQSRFWSLTYFCLLGLGFIVAELTFIQKYMIFLGGPIYALSVTLFSILVFGGLGAYAAKRIDVLRASAPASLSVLVVLLLLATIAFLHWGLPRFLGLEFGVRVVAGIFSLAPVSFLMGMPFPVGIRILERTAPPLIAWAWGCNACLTVIGSILSVIVAMSWGFTVSLMVAVACYALAGWSAYRMSVRMRSAHGVPALAG